MSGTFGDSENVNVTSLEFMVTSLYTNMTSLHTTMTSVNDMPLYGWPGTTFYTLHACAISCLITSMAVGSTVLVIFFRGIRQDMTSFWKQPIGDRLMVYLIVADLGSAITHCTDHFYILMMKHHPPDIVCRLFGAVLMEFTTAQDFIITFTSVSACVLIVWSKKLGMGSKDSRLLAVAFGTPVIIGIVGFVFKLFGPSGAWCLADMRTMKGKIFYQTFSIIHLAVLLIICVCYTTIFVYIIYTARRVQGRVTSKYYSTIRSLMMYILAFLLQWWPMVVITFWSFWTDPHEAFMIFAMFVINLGPCYNAVAYFYLKRTRQRKRRRESVQMSRSKTYSEGSTSGHV